LYEVALNSKYKFLSNTPDKENEQMAITTQKKKMELSLLYPALTLIVLDHCMKLYRIPTNSFQVMHWTKKEQRAITM
jgi:hypothetical protein